MLVAATCAYANKEGRVRPTGGAGGVYQQRRAVGRDGRGQAGRGLCPGHGLRILSAVAVGETLCL